MNLDKDENNKNKLEVFQGLEQTNNQSVNSKVNQEDSQSIITEQAEKKSSEED